MANQIITPKQSFDDSIAIAAKVSRKHGLVPSNTKDEDAALTMFGLLIQEAIEQDRLNESEQP